MAAAPEQTGLARTKIGKGLYFGQIQVAIAVDFDIAVIVDVHYLFFLKLQFGYLPNVFTTEAGGRLAVGEEDGGFDENVAAMEGG